jgi:serine/threonine-protein kinase
VTSSANVADRLIGGRYALRHRIGSGGMAEVHLARDRRLERDVALKLLGTRLAADPAFAARFRRWSRLAFRSAAA